MTLFLLMTNSPHQPCNWEPNDDDGVVAHGCTVKNQWWWLTHSRQALDSVVRELLRRNPDPVPLIELTIHEVDEIPEECCLPR